MNSSPAFQFYPRDYLTDEKVQIMGLEHEGPYIRALCHCWLEGSIPRDPVQLSRLIGKGCSEEQARVVQGCFNQMATDTTRLVHKRLDLEREKQRLWAEKSSYGGKKSGETRKKKAKLKGGLRVVEPKGNIASSSSSSSSSTKKKDQDRFAPPTFDEVADYCKSRSNGVDPSAFIAFYQSKGWRVGFQPMRDWKSAIITWEKRNGSAGLNFPPPSVKVLPPSHSVVL